MHSFPDFIARNSFSLKILKKLKRIVLDIAKSLVPRCDQR